MHIFLFVTLITIVQTRLCTISIVEQEPFTIGICRFLKKRSQVLQIQTYISIKTKIELELAYVFRDIAIQFDSEEHCW